MPHPLRRRLLLGNTFTPRSLPSIRLWLDAQKEAARMGLVAPILTDGFSRADDATGLGTAPTGQVWTEVVGNWSIASGTARCDNTAGGKCTSAALALNGRLSARTRSSNIVASNGYLLARYIDATNYLYVGRTAGALIIAKSDGGVTSTLASAGTGATNNVWDRVEVRMSGDQIDVYLNGTLTTQHTLVGADSTKFSAVAANGVGLARGAATAATVEYDDVVLSTGESALLLSSWSDDGPYGFTFSQATATKQPLLTYSVSARGILVPVVRFDGVDDLLVRAAIDVSSAGQGWVHAAVGKLFSVTGFAALFASGDEAAATRFVGGGRTGDKVRMFQRDNDTQDSVDSAASMAINTAYLLDINSDGTAYRQAMNGAALSLNVSGGANNGDWFGDTADRDNFTVGALKRTTEDSFFAGDLHSIVLTDAPPSAAQLRSLGVWDSRRYSMGIL